MDDRLWGSLLLERRGAALLLLRGGLRAALLGGGFLCHWLISSPLHSFVVCYVSVYRISP